MTLVLFKYLDTRLSLPQAAVKFGSWNFVLEG